MSVWLLLPLLVGLGYGIEWWLSRRREREARIDALSWALQGLPYSPSVPVRHGRVVGLRAWAIGYHVLIRYCSNAFLKAEWINKLPSAERDEIYLCSPVYPTLWKGPVKRADGPIDFNSDRGLYAARYFDFRWWAEVRGQVPVVGLVEASGWTHVGEKRWKAEAVIVRRLYLIPRACCGQAVGPMDVWQGTESIPMGDRDQAGLICYTNTGAYRGPECFLDRYAVFGPTNLAPGPVSLPSHEIVAQFEARYQCEVRCLSEASLIEELIEGCGVE